MLAFFQNNKLRIMATAGFAILLSLLILAYVPFNGESSRKTDLCTYRLKQLCLALQQYHDIYKQFPPVNVKNPEGKPMHSWRRLVLPYTDYAYDLSSYDANSAWNSPANLAVGRPGLFIFQCPHDTANRSDNFTSYFALLEHCSQDAFVLIEVHGADVQWSRPLDFDVLDLKSIVKRNLNVGNSQEPPGVIVIGPDCRMTRLPINKENDFINKLNTLIGEVNNLKSGPTRKGSPDPDRIEEKGSGSRKRDQE